MELDIKPLKVNLFLLPLLVFNHKVICQTYVFSAQLCEQFLLKLDLRPLFMLSVALSSTKSTTYILHPQHVWIITITDFLLSYCLLQLIFKYVQVSSIIYTPSYRFSWEFDKCLLLSHLKEEIKTKTKQKHFFYLNQQAAIAPSYHRCFQSGITAFPYYLSAQIVSYS